MTVTTTDVLQTKLTIDGKEYTLELKNARTSLDRFDKDASKSFAGIRSSYLQMAAANNAGGYSAKKVFDFARAGAQIKDLEYAFRRMGGTAQSMRDLRNAVNSTIDDVTLMRMSNMGQTLGINAEQYVELSKVGKAAAKVLGIDVKYAMESVITGTARQSKLWLDNLGIIVDVEAAQKRYAESIGKVASALTEAEKKQAFINATILEGQEIIGVAGSGGAVDSYDQFAASIANLADVIKKKIDPSVQEALSGMADTFKNFASVIQLFESGGIQTGSVTVDIPQATQDLVNRAAARRSAKARADAIHAQAPKGQESGLAAFLSQQEAETNALIESQQAMLDARATFNTDQIASIAAFYDTEQQMAIEQGAKLVAAQESINQRLSQSYQTLFGNVTNALMAFGETQKVGFILQRAGAAASAYIHGMAGAAAAVAPPPVGLGPVAGLPLSKKLALLTKLNVAAILATSFASPKSGGSGDSGVISGTASTVSTQGQAQNITLNVSGAGNLVNKEALAEMFFSGFGDLLQASGGQVGNINIVYND